MTEKYPLSFRILHWLIAVLILGLLAVGLTMERMDHANPLRGTLFALHKSFGLTVLALALLRLILRLRLPIPPLPEVIPAIERILAHLGHWALYLFMVLLPVTGFVLTQSFGKQVAWFGVPMPHLLGIDIHRGEFAANVHAYGAYTLIVLLVFHVSAVGVHYLREHVNLLKRMW